MKKRTAEKLKELLEEHMLASEKEKCVGMIRRLYLTFPAYLVNLGGRL